MGEFRQYRFMVATYAAMLRTIMTVGRVVVRRECPAICAGSNQILFEASQIVGCDLRGGSAEEAADVAAPDGPYLGVGAETSKKNGSSYGVPKTACTEVITAE